MWSLTPTIQRISSTSWTAAWASWVSGRVKLHPTWHAYPPDGPGYLRVYAYLQERKGVVLSHTFGSAPILDKLSAAYPDVTFIHAHVGGGYDGRLPNPWVPLMRERPNVYLDTVLSVVHFGGFEALVEAAGADKLLMGTDAPFEDNAHQIGRVTHARSRKRTRSRSSA